jgi:hypothetical protein
MAESKLMDGNKKKRMMANMLAEVGLLETVNKIHQDVARVSLGSVETQKEAACEQAFRERYAPGEAPKPEEKEALAEALGLKDPRELNHCFKNFLEKNEEFKTPGGRKRRARNPKVAVVKAYKRSTLEMPMKMAKSLHDMYENMVDVTMYGMKGAEPKSMRRETHKFLKATHQALLSDNKKVHERAFNGSRKSPVKGDSP